MDNYYLSKCCAWLHGFIYLPLNVKQINMFTIYFSIHQIYLFVSISIINLKKKILIRIQRRCKTRLTHSNEMRRKHRLSSDNRPIMCIACSDHALNWNLIMFSWACVLSFIKRCKMAYKYWHKAHTFSQRTF